MAPYKREDISNQRQFNYLFDNLFRFTSKTISKIRITGLFFSRIHPVVLSTKDHQCGGRCHFMTQSWGNRVPHFMSNILSQIEWVEHFLDQNVDVWAAKCVVCKMRGPKQSTETDSKYTDRALSGRDANSADLRKMHGLQFNCAGRVDCATAIAQSSEWATTSTHLPRTCLAMHTECNRGSTRVGRDALQSPGAVRVYSRIAMEWCTKLEVAERRVALLFSMSFIKSQGHTGQIDDLNPIWVRILGWSVLSNSSDLTYWV